MLTLTAILLTFLFSFFVESAKIEKKLDTARMAISNRNYLQIRLQTILVAVDRSTSEPFLYTQTFEKEPSLVLIFDNGIDPDPAFSGSIFGRIFLDSDKNLCLVTWPLDHKKNSSWRKEVLLPRVKSFEFEFLGKRSATEHGKKENIRPINAALAWRNLWPRFQMETPSIIRLKVQEEKELLQFAFILPVADPYVTYLEKAS